MGDAVNKVMPLHKGEQKVVVNQNECNGIPTDLMSSFAAKLHKSALASSSQVAARPHYHY